MLKKVLGFFIEEDVEKEQDSEKELLKQELMEERKKYAKQDSPNNLKETEIVEEPIKKQVLFVDEDFERKSKSVEKKSTPVKYNDSGEKKFKPSHYISPVHGLIKPAESVPEYETEEKTKSESDYAVIRDKVFGNAVFEEEETAPDLSANSSSFKIFKTSEIVDLKKRLQVDDTPINNDSTTMEEAYADSDFVSEEPQDLFDLLNELGDPKDE